MRTAPARLARLALAAALAAALPAALAAAPSDGAAPPLADVLARARAAGKPVLLDFSTVW